MLTTLGCKDNDSEEKNYINPVRLLQGQVLSDKDYRSKEYRLIKNQTDYDDLISDFLIVAPPHIDFDESVGVWILNGQTNGNECAYNSKITELRAKILTTKYADNINLTIMHTEQCPFATGDIVCNDVFVVNNEYFFLKFNKPKQAKPINLNIKDERVNECI